MALVQDGVAFATAADAVLAHTPAPLFETLELEQCLGLELFRVRVVFGILHDLDVRLG